MISGEISMNNKKIAYCIPTRNRPQLIDAVLEYGLDILNRYNIDVYIYDSSDNCDTELVAQKYENFENFIYIKLSFDTTPVQKAKMIFNGEHQKTEYDFIWLIKDRVYWSEDLIQRIVNTASNNHDAIFLRAIETNHTFELEDKDYFDAVSLYHDWGWLITSWDVLLINSNNILKFIDWTEIMDRYSVDNNISFILVVILFDALSKKDNCNVKMLDAAAGKHIFNLPLPQDNRDSQLFNIWGYEWYYINSQLPKIYNNTKEFVIKSATSLSWIIGDYIRLINLWHDGNLKDEKLYCVKDIWDKISDIPWIDVCKIKDGDRAFMENMVSSLIWDAVERNDFQYAEYCYDNLVWMKEDICTPEFQQIVYMIEIFRYEIQTDNVHIFDGGNNKEFILSKINAVIKVLSAFENGDKTFYKQMGSQLRTLIKNSIVSSSMVVYLASRTCSDSGLVLGRILDYIIE